MTYCYLAFGANPNSINTLANCDWKDRCPKILVSYFYLKTYNLHKHKYHPTHTMLDSGAYSAWNSGKTIDIDALCEEIKNPYWKEAVGLDVIGDAEGSLKNALYMKRKGVNAMPVFHIGDPWEILQEYCKQFDKVGLSCRFGESIKTSDLWNDQCFARQWPHKFHSFGWLAEKSMMRVPFHSADSSSWALGPGAFGTWREFGKLSIRGKIDLTAQVDSVLRMERRLQTRWKKEMALLESKSKIDSNQGALL